MNKKITVITTGGTIGSILQSTTVSIDESSRQVIVEIEKAKKKLGYSVDVISAFNKNSESVSPFDWITLLKVIEEVNDSDSDGIVVTHGTDTLAYTLAAVLAFKNKWKKKICFTGSYYSPDHPFSDTSLSLMAALEFAVSSYPAEGIYVAFRSKSDNSEARIMNAEIVKPMQFDEQFFHSTYEDIVCTYNPDSGLSDVNFPDDSKNPCFLDAGIPKKAEMERNIDKVACLYLYPGITKAFLHQATAGKDIVVIGMYHSGTGPASNDYDDLIEYINESVGRTILMGSFPKRYIELPYDSTVILKKSGARVYAELQVHQLYVFSLIGKCIGKSNNEILDRLIKWEL